MSGHLSRYILRRALRAFLVATLIVAALIALVDFVEATRDVDADSGLNAFDLFQLTLLELPSLLEQTLPFIVLFGTIGALNGLNRRSELIAARAAGISAWRYLRPALIATALLGVGWITVGNPVAGRMLAQHDAIRAADTGGDRLAEEIWLRESTPSHRAVLRADALDLTTRTLTGVTYLGFARAEGGDVFERRIDARSATWLPTGYLQFDQLTEWVDGTLQPAPALSLPTTITERDLVSKADSGGLRSRLPPIWGLPGLIADQRAAGYATLLPRMAFWKLAGLPILLVAMAVIGATVSMRLSREGGTWRLILAGGAVGFAVFFSSVFVEAFGEVGTLPPLVAALTVPLVTLVVGLAYLARLEDG